MFSQIFALGYLCGLFFFILSLNYGALSLSVLIYSFSMMTPVIYAAVFLNEDISLMAGIGLFLAAFSIFLITFNKGKTPKCPKWIYTILLAFLFNSICFIVQKHHQYIFFGTI